MAPFQFAVCIGCVIANHVVAGQAMKVCCPCICTSQLMSFRADGFQSSEKLQCHLDSLSTHLLMHTSGGILSEQELHSDAADI